MTSKPGLLNISTVGILGQTILYVGAAPLLLDVEQHPWPLLSRCQWYPPPGCDKQNN